MSIVSLWIYLQQIVKWPSCKIRTSITWLISFHVFVGHNCYHIIFPRCTYSWLSILWGQRIQNDRNLYLSLIIFYLCLHLSFHSLDLLFILSLSIAPYFLYFSSTSTRCLHLLFIFDSLLVIFEFFHLKFNKIFVLCKGLYEILNRCLIGFFHKKLLHFK